jgi:hypothetical protein
MEPAARKESKDGIIIIISYATRRSEERKQNVQSLGYFSK